jgi:hypothetical protein
MVLLEMTGLRRHLLLLTSRKKYYFFLRDISGARFDVG